MEHEIYVRRAQNEQDYDQFIKFPTTIYQSVPEQASSAIAHRKMFLERQKAEARNKSTVECFIAFEGSEVAGTIVTIINDEYNRKHRAPTGFLAFFETIQNRMVSLALFDIAHFWLKKQGMDTLRGAIQYSEGIPSIAGFPYYYMDFIESYGFKKTCEHFDCNNQGEKIIENYFLGIGGGEPKCGVSAGRPQFTVSLGHHEKVMDAGLFSTTDGDSGKVICYGKSPENCKPLQSYEYKMV